MTTTQYKIEAENSHLKQGLGYSKTKGNGIKNIIYANIIILAGCMECLIRHSMHPATMLTDLFAGILTLLGYCFIECV